MSAMEFGDPYVDEDWPHGLRCAECSCLIEEGDRYSQRLSSFQDDIPVVLIVCVTCALADTPVSRGGGVTP